MVCSIRPDHRCSAELSAVHGEYLTMPVCKGYTQPRSVPSSACRGSCSDNREELGSPYPADHHSLHHLPAASSSTVQASPCAGKETAIHSSRSIYAQLRFQAMVMWGLAFMSWTDTWPAFGVTRADASIHGHWSAARSSTQSHIRDLTSGHLAHFGGQVTNTSRRGGMTTNLTTQDGHY